jgi:hypothetical protein
MIIIGCGLAGLLAARYFNHLTPVIYEKNDTVPNNHSALLRFRSDIVSNMIGIPFKSIEVTKAILTEDGIIQDTASLRDHNAYSFKVLGRIVPRSIVNLSRGSRYIAPENLIPILLDGANVCLQTDGRDLFASNGSVYNTPIISTIPMPVLMKILNYPHTEQFDYRPTWNVNCKLYEVEAYQTVYVPYGPYSPYRVSITGNKFTLEYAKAPDASQLEEDIETFIRHMFGGHKIDYSHITLRQQEFGKIMSISDQVRKDFMFWASNKHGIYSLGRYATWRNILLDDLVKDLHMIAKFMSNNSAYELKQETGR